MPSFFALNKYKIGYLLLFSLFVVVTLTGIILAIAYFKDQFPDTPLLLKILFSTAVIGPLFITGLVLIISLINVGIGNRLLKKIDRLDSSNVKVTFDTINEDTKWFFTETSRKITINSIEILCYVNHINKHSVVITCPISSVQNINSSTLKILEEHQIKVNTYNTSLYKVYHFKTFKKMSAAGLHQELIQFANKITQLI